MTDLPAAAITAAHAAIACNVGDPGWAGKLKLSPHDLADIALAAAAPHITAAAAAAERQRIIALASQLRAAIPADHPEGAQASFADYLLNDPVCDWAISITAERQRCAALVHTWLHDITANRTDAVRGKREDTAEGSDLHRYHQGYADALDRCVQDLLRKGSHG